MAKRRALAAAAALAMATVAWPFGSAETGDYQPVEGTENWTRGVDTSQLKEGTYNVIVRAADRAGNVSYGGPIDIRIDPDSDLPIVNVSNPTQGQRVGNNLNVLGTCVDDDAVERIEVRVDGGAPVAAQGKEYWSYYLEVAGLEDGLHTLTVRGIDSNGLEGAPFTVSFHLDKKGPVLRVESHGNGVLLNSRAVVNGVAEDSNGIEEVSLSRDNRATWESLRIDAGKNALSAAFRFEIDTTRLDAGPHVYWLRATDKTGSQDRVAFLFFVDNEPPRLEILSPAEDAPASGNLTVVGTVVDDVGIRSLAVSVNGGQETPVALVPGNRFWAQTVELGGDRSTTVTFTAQDIAGNRTRVSRRVAVDAQAGLPVVKISAPAAGATVTGAVVLAGSVRDDKQVKGIEISVDGAAARAIDTQEAFVVDLEPLQPGTHRISVRGLDAEGRRGPESRLEITKSAPRPRVDIASLVVGEESRPFAPGLVVPAGTAARLLATASAGAGALDVTVGSTPPRRVSAADRFEIALARDLPQGRVDITIAQPGAGEPIFRGFVYKGQVTEAAGLILSDARVGSGGRANVAEDQPLRLFLAGAQATSAEAEPRSDRIAVQASGSIVTVTPRNGGSAEPFRVRVATDSGGTLLSEPLTVVSDFEPPRITISEPSTGVWVRDTVKLAGSVAEPGGLQSLEVSTAGAEAYRSLDLKRNAGGATFEQTLPLPAEEGLVVLSVRARDLAGNEAVTHVALGRDSVAPSLSIIAPGPTDPVEGTVTLTGIVSDAGALERVELSDDGKTFVPVEGRPVFRHDIDLAAYKKLPEAFTLRGVDRAGNTATLPVALKVDQSKDRPRVEIQIPENGAVIRGDSAVSGMAFDDDGVRAIVYRLDGGGPVRIEVQGSFSIPLALASLADNEHRIEVTAEDIRGVTGEPVSVGFLVSTAEPTAALSKPASGETVRGHVLLEGTADDKNDIGSVAVSFDNGNTFNKAEGGKQWRYPLNTALLEDGTHAIQIRVVDKTGTEALYSALLAVDNTGPQLALTSVKDGDRVAGSLIIDGRAADRLRLASLQYRIRSLEKATDKPLVAAGLPPSGVFSQLVDVSALAAGWYNLELDAVDAAGNTTSLSRNFVIALKGQEAGIDMIFPAEGESLAGEFTIDGRVRGGAVEGEVAILVDGAPAGTAAVRNGGWFTLAVASGTLAAGPHSIAARARLAGGASVESAPRGIEYSAVGPWLSFADVLSGGYVSGRPVLSGRAGWSGGADSPQGKERDRSLDVSRVELSFDNGRTFVPVKGMGEWQYRLDTSLLPDGEMVILARSRHGNGEQAVRKLLVIVDDTPPQVRLAVPSEDARFNASVSMAGTAWDESGLSDVTASLREGGKGRYEVPAFIQGLYLDAHALGATYGDLGLGFTFFDDNVRLQMQIGASPSGRFSGLVIGTKLLANILTLPLSYWFGPSWDFLSTSLALGANFSYFSMSEDSIAFTSEGLVLAAVVAQWEMARFDLRDTPMLSFVALYTEGNFWFISSDISAGVESRLCFGIRMGLF